MGLCCCFSLEKGKSKPKTTVVSMSHNQAHIPPVNASPIVIPSNTGHIAALPVLSPTLPNRPSDPSTAVLVASPTAPNKAITTHDTPITPLSPPAANIGPPLLHSNPPQAKPAFKNNGKSIFIVPRVNTNPDSATILALETELQSPAAGIRTFSLTPRSAINPLGAPDPIPSPLRLGAAPSLASLPPLSLVSLTNPQMCSPLRSEGQSTNIFENLNGYKYRAS